MYDIVVIGGGPAGMTAALYGCRNGKSVLIIERDNFGGQMTNSPKLENYPGYSQISGNELAEKMLDQITAQGVEIVIAEANAVQDHGSYKTVVAEEETYDAKSVIIASGVKHRLLGLDGEEDLIGEGVSFCAVCDGDFYKNREVCVVGGASSALQEALLLSKKCSKVTLVHYRDRLAGEVRLQEVLATKDNVEVLLNKKVDELLVEDDELVGVRLENCVSGEKSTLPCDGIFVAIGLIPENTAFEDVASLDDYGYFDAGEECSTKTAGVYVAGDCRKKINRQVTTAVSDGAVAALAACRYVDGIS